MSAASGGEITLQSGVKVGLVLASSSPRRLELLRYLGLPFEIIPSRCEENFDPSWRPERVVLELARRKAEQVASALPADRRHIVIGGDTIVVLDDRILGKPENFDDACGMLACLQGRKHTVYTGIAIIDTAAGDVKQGFERSDVYFRPLVQDEIRAYVASGEPRDKAGSYALQGLGAAIVQKIDGCYSNVIGLPVPLVVRLLRESGVSVLGLP